MESTVVSEIVCQKIRLVNSQGDTVAVLGTEETEETESPGPTFQMYNTEGLATLELSVDSQGAGSVVVRNKHEKPAVTARVDSDDDSGQIVVHNRHSGIAVLVDAARDEDSGRITVWRDGKPVAQVNSNANGGSVSVYSAKDVKSGVIVGTNSDDSGQIIVFRDEKIAVSVYADTDGGNLAVWGDWGTAVKIDSDDDGGYVAVKNKDRHEVVWAGTDADGDGTVLTFEDGNVTSRMPRGGR